VADELIVIERIMHEHEAIRGHMNQVYNMMNEWEETCPEESAELNSQELHFWSDKQNNLKQTINYLEDGLRNHHEQEDEKMPSLVGSPLMEALRIEHYEMIKQLGEINFILLNVNAQGLVANGSYLKMIIDNMCQLVNSHCCNEDVILQLLKRRYI